MNEDRYRVAESALFKAAGITPREHWVRLVGGCTRARVLEVGEGRPTLFLTGGPQCAATWSFVAAATRGLRCLLLDRPGTGLSEPPPRIPDADALPGYAAALVPEVLDAMGLARAPVVASSFGGFAALRGAIAHPGRIEHIVLAGCPAFVPGWTAPRFFTWLRTPLLGAALLSLPPTAASVRHSLQQMGHAEALRQGAIPAPMLEWMRAWQRDTDTMAHDAEMIRRGGTWRGGFAAHLDLTEADLRQVRPPCHVLIGSADPVGGVDVARRLASCLGQASVEVMEGAGHLPWLDDPLRVAQAASRCIAGATDGTVAPSEPEARASAPAATAS